MAESVTTINVTRKWDDGKAVHVAGTLSIAAGDYTTNGIALNFTPKLSTKVAPYFVEVKGIAGYLYEYDTTNKKLIIRQCAAAGNPQAQLSAAATPAGVTGDTIRFYLVSGKLT